jgi:hypothetical protein
MTEKQESEPLQLAALSPAKMVGFFCLPCANQRLGEVKISYCLRQRTSGAKPLVRSSNRLRSLDGISCGARRHLFTAAGRRSAALAPEPIRWSWLQLLLTFEVVNMGRILRIEANLSI